MPDSTILLTGISGFIAKHCAIELLNEGYRVRGTVRSLARSTATRDTVGRYANTGALEFVEADLEADGGWDEAVAGCAGVLHLASPFPASQPRDEQELIRPAVQGTLRVLRAAVSCGVARFVQTSSTVAVMYGHGRARTAPFTEVDWTNVDAPGVTAYAKSKTLAERAARDFLAREAASLQFSTVNPGFVMGPVLDRDIGASAEIVRMFLQGRYPGAPRLCFPCVDVRDIARMHRLALEAPLAQGGRYLGVGESLWMIDIARAISERLGSTARKVPTRVLPDWAVRLVALFDATARQALPDLGVQIEVDNSHTRRALGMEFRSGREAAAAMAASLVELKLV